MGGDPQQQILRVDDVCDAYTSLENKAVGSVAPILDRHLTHVTFSRRAMFMCAIMEVRSNVHAYTPDVPVSSVDCTTYTPGIGTLFSSLISSGENLAFAHVVFSFQQVPISNWYLVEQKRLKCRLVVTLVAENVLNSPQRRSSIDSVPLLGMQLYSLLNS